MDKQTSESISKSFFGNVPDGEEIYMYELTNNNGFKINLLNFGATLTAVKVPLEKNEFVDVVLGFDNLESYLQSFNLVSPPYLGATVGRYAGRIKNASFILNHKTIKLNSNNPNYALHGGINGFSKKIWQLKEVHKGLNPSLTFSFYSENGEEGFPGGLTTILKYTLTEENEICLEYNATTTDDTVINLTHHSYFNLDGHKADVLNQDLWVNAHQMLDTNKDNIPTGKFLSLLNTPFDFSSAKKCLRSIDNSFVLHNNNEAVATLYSSKNNLKMSVFTDQPSVHIYIGGNCFNQIRGKENANYHTTSGICFETQNFPDAPNYDHFPNAVLKKGAIYQQKTRYKFEFVYAQQS